MGTASREEGDKRIHMMNNIKLKKGILIALEGIDGAGKTTQAKNLLDILTKEGYDAVCFKEPTAGQWGLKIREIALNGRNHITVEDELNYFIFDRKEDVKENIQPALDSNKIVIMDRYYYSNIAYQGALGIDPEEIRKKNESEEKFPIPNVVIILNVAPNIGTSRIRKLRKEQLNKFEEEKYLVKVRNIFNEMKEENIQIIDGARTIEDVEEHILNIAHNIIEPAIIKNRCAPLNVF
jgi:dTMP kinase